MTAPHDTQRRERRVFADVQGRCPACGSETLFLGNGGYVTCSLLGCPNPTAASDALIGHVQSDRRNDQDVQRENARLRKALGDIARCKVPGGGGVKLPVEQTVAFAIQALAQEPPSPPTTQEARADG